MGSMGAKTTPIPLLTSPFKGEGLKQLTSPLKGGNIKQRKISANPVR
jgi:hypothetical protein